jgi:dynein heavy chain, axonemal
MQVGLKQVENEIEQL